MNIIYTIYIGDIINFLMMFLTFVELTFAAIELRKGKMSIGRIW